MLRAKVEGAWLERVGAGQERGADLDALGWTMTGGKEIGNVRSAWRVPVFMFRATWNGAVLAESDDTVVVEGNHYFPFDTVDRLYLRESATHTRCPWKGTASYFSVVVGEKENPDAAWYYQDPSPAASEVTGRVAFWRGVTIERIGSSDRETDVPVRSKQPMLARLRRH